MGRRDALIECFGDTMRLCRSEELAGRVEASREETRLIGVSDAVDAPETVPSQSTVRVSVTPDRTFEAAQRLVAQSPDSRCAVLNFASPVNPGGGVDGGVVRRVVGHHTRHERHARGASAFCRAVSIALRATGLCAF